MGYHRQCEREWYVWAGSRQQARMHQGSCEATHQSPEAKESREYLRWRQTEDCRQSSHGWRSPGSGAVTGGAES